MPETMVAWALRPQVLAPFAFIVAGGSGIWLTRYWRARRSPDERERRRRIRVHLVGRMTEVTVLQADAETLDYIYEVGGVSYHASQEIRRLDAVLPRPAEQLVGIALAKYDPRNPANSIVICEHWSGFRTRQ